MTTYTHDSELQTITAPLFISTLYKSPQHTLSFSSPSLVTASNSGDSSASADKSYLNRGFIPTDGRRSVFCFAAFA
jgi:hypothetical protein